MELRFFSVTTCGTSCVSMLVHELDQIEAIAETWDFPYSIGIVIRCVGNAGKTFRRFDKTINDLTIDIREKDSEYIILSKNEQRERLGKILYSYFVESINKYPKFATESQRTCLISNMEQWLIANNWLNGKIEQARLLLTEDIDLFEVSQLLGMSFEEIEDIFLKLHETERRTKTHDDNILANKGMPPA